MPSECQGWLHVSLHQLWVIITVSIYLGAEGTRGPTRKEGWFRGYPFIKCHLQMSKQDGKSECIMSDHTHSKVSTTEDVLKCSFCNNKGATVGCDLQSCAKNYHLLCAKEDHAILQVDEDHGTYKLFCQQHASEGLEPTQRDAAVTAPFLKKCQEAGLLTELFEQILDKMDSIPGRLMDETASESDYDRIETLLFESGLFGDTLRKFQESKVCESEERQRQTKQQLEALADLQQTLGSFQENGDLDPSSSTSGSLVPPEDHQVKCQGSEVQAGSGDSL